MSGNGKNKKVNKDVETTPVEEIIVAEAVVEELEEIVSDSTAEDAAVKEYEESQDEELGANEWLVESNTVVLTPVALRLVLNELARAQSLPGYVRIATSEYDENGDLWTVSRLDEQLDAKGNEIAPAQIRLTLEPSQLSKLDAEAKLRARSSEMGDAILRIRSLSKIRNVPGSAEETAVRAEISKLSLKVRICEHETERLHKQLSRQREQHFHFPIDLAGVVLTVTKGA